MVQHFLSLVDTTRYKSAEQNAALLIDELNHRVKNTLATVQSIVTQAVRNFLYAVGRILGHVDHQSTQRYAHLANDTLMAAVEAGASKLNVNWAGEA